LLRAFIVRSSILADWVELIGTLECAD